MGKKKDLNDVDECQTFVNENMFKGFPKRHTVWDSYLHLWQLLIGSGSKKKHS